MPPSPVRLNHAVLYVTDLERSVRFYGELLGMEVTAHEPQVDAAFLRLPESGNHHDLGLFGVPGARRSGHPTPGLYHLAWQFNTIDDLVAARQAVIDLGAYQGESSHGATKSVYGTDPDGNGFELMWMLPRDHWGDFEFAAPVEPLDFPSEVAKWSGVATAGTITGGHLHGTVTSSDRDVDCVAANPDASPPPVDGLSEEVATGTLNDARFVVRVVERDGEQFPMTMDYRDNRVNLIITNGVVTSATIG